jgi:hypothetical protein
VPGRYFYLWAGGTTAAFSLNLQKQYISKSQAKIHKEVPPRSRHEGTWMEIIAQRE